MPDDAITQRLIDYGTLGMAFVLLLGAFLWVVRKLFQERDARLAEVKAYATALEQNKGIVESNVTAMNGVRASLDAGNQVMSGVKTSVDSVHLKVEGIYLKLYQGGRSRVRK